METKTIHVITKGDVRKGDLITADQIQEQLVDGIKYLLGGKVAPYITCTTCNKTSYNSEDIRNKYCGYCKEFHEGWKGESYIIGEREE